jgi:hypothetical protein
MSDKIYVFSDEDIKSMKEHDGKYDRHFIPKPNSDNKTNKEENQNDCK